MWSICGAPRPSGQTIATMSNRQRASQLREQLAKKPEHLARGVTRHLITYSTGASVTHLDQRAIDDIVKSAAADDYGLRSLIHGVIQSDLFRSK